MIEEGFPGGSAVKNPPTMQESQGTRFDLWARKMPRRTVWQSTPVLLPGESHE